MKRMLCCLSLIFATVLLTPSLAQTYPVGEYESMPLEKTTYPIDSCPPWWFMSPFQMVVQVSGSPTRARFQLTGNSNLMIEGSGTIGIRSCDSLYPGWDIHSHLMMETLMTLPDPSSDPDNWPGGQPPFPVLLNGFITRIEGQVIDPPEPFMLQVRDLFYEDLSQ